MKVVSWILGKVDGWKTVIGIILAQLPWFSDKPWLLEAIQKVLANPYDAEAWGSVIVQVLILVGVLHRVRKNLR